MPKFKSKKQVGFLLSKWSPLTREERGRLLSELHSRKVLVRENPPKAPVKPSRRSKVKRRLRLK